MSRKKALIALATIEGLLSIIVILLYLIGKLSVFGLIVSYLIITLLTLLAIFIIIRKTDPE